MQQGRGFINIGESITQVAEVWEEWFGSRSVQERVDTVDVESTFKIQYGTHATCVASKGIPLCLFERSVK